MKCQAAQEQLVDALKEGPSIELENHLRECADCRSMLADFTSVASTLHEMPEIEPTPHVIHSVKRQMMLGQARSGRIRRLFRVTWAAVAVAGILATLLLLNGGASERVVAYVFRFEGAGYHPSQGLAADTAYDFSGYTTLTLPEIGIARLREGSRVRFASPSDVVLEKGEIFVEVTSKPKDGFRVHTEKFIASVTGTEFGVTADDVYVRTGTVRVSRGEASVSVVAGQLLHVNGGALQPTRVDPLTLMGWVREYEAPAVKLALISNRKLTLIKPETVSLKLTNSSRFWPAYLRSLEPGGGFLRMKLVSRSKQKEEFTVSLDQIKVKALYEDRLIRIEEGAPVEVQVTLAPELFAGLGQSGIFDASFVYTSGGDQDSRIWTGTVESRDTLEIEIRK